MTDYWMEQARSFSDQLALAERRETSLRLRAESAERRLTSLVRLSRLGSICFDQRPDGVMWALLEGRVRRPDGIPVQLVGAGATLEEAVQALDQVCIDMAKIVRCVDGDQLEFEYESDRGCWVLRSRLLAGGDPARDYSWLDAWAAWGLRRGLLPLVEIEPCLERRNCVANHVRQRRDCGPSADFAVLAWVDGPAVYFAMPTDSVGVAIAYDALAFAGVETEKAHHANVLARFEQDATALGFSVGRRAREHNDDHVHRR